MHHQSKSGTAAVSPSFFSLADYFLLSILTISKGVKINYAQEEASIN
jgi:hypothetical protein